MTHHQSDATGALTDQDTPAETGGVESDLALLLATAEESIARTATIPVLNVNGRDGYSLVCEVGELTSEQTRKWRKIATRKGRGAEADPAIWFALIIANTCVEIRRHGKTFRDSTGDKITFTSRELIDGLGVDNADQAVCTFIGADAAILAIGNKILEAAGYGAEFDADEEGPTD